MPTLQAIRADITTLSVGAIVNAANSTLLGDGGGGGSIYGAIHRAAGPKLLQACRELHGCDVGDAKLTPGFELKSQRVIHTVGPVWQGGGHGEAEQLASCYRRCIEIAEDDGADSIAFPAISTGAYGYPVESAARIAVTAVGLAVESTPIIGEVLFCCFSRHDLGIYRSVLMQPV